MITDLANVIADFFADNNIINSKEREIYVYGSEALLSAFLNTIIVLLSGLVTHEIINAFIFYFVFLVMRKYCGGYHAKTHLRCNLILTLNILTVLMLIKNISTINISFYISAIVISNTLIFWLAPIENENKPLESYEIKKYRKIAILLSSIFNITEEQVNGHTTYILKEDKQFTAAFVDRRIKYLIFAEDSDYDECQEILENMS